MSLTLFKIAANRLSNLADSMYEKAANVSEGTLNTAKKINGVLSILMLMKMSYNLYNGDNFFYPTVTVIDSTVLFFFLIMSIGVIDIEAAKAAQFNLIKPRIQHIAMH